jgi:deoxycytidylate deaminase
MTVQGSEPTIVSLIGSATAPPEWAIEDAVDAARLSPCQKRKVGISVYYSLRPLEGGRELAQATSASGYNGPPWTWDGDDPDVEGACDGSEACRRDCARRCVHAEPRAIDAITQDRRDYGHRLRLVHVKLDDAGKVMACDGPSCIDCSKQILDAGIGGIWLYEQVPDGDPAWRYYRALDFHEATERRLGIHRVPR